MKRLLVVDDEEGPRRSLELIFSGRYAVTTAAGADAAAEVLASQTVDLALLDVIMPGRSGLDLLRDIQAAYPDIPVIMISASNSVKPVVEAMRMGAYDYITKPFEVADILHTVEQALESKRLRRQVETLEQDMAREFPVGNIVGESPAFRDALRDLETAAETDATVLIQGESGTGKELAARLIHARSDRRDEPFVAVHCAALSEALMESELFGHERGAFTSADRQKPGRFDLAGSGTLFFDELAEMSPSTQVKLLRVLQEHEFMRVGGTHVIRTNARIVAATSKDLRAEAREGTFRDDLYYRVSVVPVNLPPLRERTDDIALLARYFLRHFRQALDGACEDFDPEAMDRLCRYPWPGNVRELRNIVERTVVLHRQETLVRPEFLPEEFHAETRPAVSLPPGLALQDAVGDFERQLILTALDESGWVQTRAAERLGTTRRILAYRMTKLHIEPGGAA